MRRQYVPVHRLQGYCTVLRSTGNNWSRRGIEGLRRPEAFACRPTRCLYDAPTPASPRASPKLTPKTSSFAIHSHRRTSQPSQPSKNPPKTLQRSNPRPRDDAGVERTLTEPAADSATKPEPTEPPLLPTGIGSPFSYTCNSQSMDKRKEGLGLAEGVACVWARGCSCG
jgi:hypothetical protein